MAKKLIDIIDESLIIEVSGNQEVDVESIEIDSRQVVAGSMYVAIPGSAVDGHRFIDAAIEAGATSILCKTMPKDVNPEVVYIQVEDTRATLGILAAAYYGDPSEAMTVVGVTGTNGKTTVSTLLYQLFTRLGFTCGLISTVEYVVGVERYSSTHTTPDAVRLQRLFREMKDAGCSHVFMEVSSHAIDQGRIVGVDFDVAVFTNISRDHLDYHKTFKDYIWTKKRFFDTLEDDAYSIINIDDKNGHVMVQNSKSRLISYALRRPASMKGRLIANDILGMTLEVNGSAAMYRMVGEFNAYNLLAVLGVVRALDEDVDEAIVVLSGLSGAEGRFEVIGQSGSGPVGIVDYAHTPDALENVLQTIQKTRNASQKIITIVGCGGDRDKGKRPMMAAVAARYSDRVICTSDNPRSEDPEMILDDMMEGLGEQDADKVIRITDRRQAIWEGVRMASDDIILIAGKGHEKYQDIKGVKTPFDDKKVLREALSQRT